MNPEADVVIAYFSTAEPYAPDVPFEENFERDRRAEAERRHLCHVLSERLAQQVNS